jgi:hypothetical protein
VLSSYTTWTCGRFTDDPVLDLFVTLHPGSMYSTGCAAYDSATGARLWARSPDGPMYEYAAVCDLDADGFDDVLYNWLFGYHHVRGPTGQDFFDEMNIPGYHTPRIFDADGDGVVEVFLGGAYGTMGVLNACGRWLWRVETGYEMNGRTPAVGDFDGDGVLEALVYWQRATRLECRDVLTGTVEWQQDQPDGPGPMVAGDLDGDGRDEALAPLGSELVCFDGSDEFPQHVRWRVAVGEGLGMPLLTDYDGDGKVEIIVPSSDGWVYGLDEARERGE